MLAAARPKPLPHAAPPVTLHRLRAAVARQTDRDLVWETHAKEAEKVDDCFDSCAYLAARLWPARLTRCFRDDATAERAQYALFISYYRDEAGAEYARSRLVQYA